MTVFSKSIVANADDGHQYSTAIDSGQAYCFFGNEMSTVLNSYFRFTNVTIPQGSTIISAKLVLVAQSTRTGTTCNIRISCEDADSAAQISSYSDYSGRVLTTAYKDWTVAGWTDGNSYDSDDFKSVLQEVIDRAGWSSGNAVQVFVRNNSSSTDARRYAASIEHASYNPPQLVVEYTTPVEADISDTTGLNDSVDAFSLTDSISDAAGIGDSADAYNTDSPIADAFGIGDTADASGECFVSDSDMAGIGDTADAGFEADGAMSDVSGFGDSSDGFNYTAWFRANRDRSVIRYYCTLTGAADGLSDLTIPISSFQASKRTGESTYLSVIVPGMEQAEEIADRSNGELVIYMAYLLDGVESLREEILRVDLEQINPQEGARSRSITLIGHKTVTYDSRAASIQGCNYKYTSNGSRGFRFPQADPYLNPGDALTVIDTDDALTVDYITYAISARGAKFMEVREG